MSNSGPLLAAAMLGVVKQNVSTPTPTKATMPASMYAWWLMAHSPNVLEPTMATTLGSPMESAAPLTAAGASPVGASMVLSLMGRPLRPPAALYCSKTAVATAAASGNAFVSVIELTRMGSPVAAPPPPLPEHPLSASAAAPATAATTSTFLEMRIDIASRLVSVTLLRLYPESR